MIPVTATFPEENSHKELPGKEPNGKEVKYMATFSNKSTRMALRVQTGTTPEGDPVLSSLSWGGVSASATADNIDAVAAALEGLLSVPLVEIQKNATDMVI